MDVRQNRDDQIKQIEETLSKETERSTDLKSKLCESRSATIDLESALSEAKVEITSLKTEINMLKTDKEKLACQLADISGSAVASAKSFTSKNESLQKMVSIVPCGSDGPLLLIDLYICYTDNFCLL